MPVVLLRGRVAGSWKDRDGKLTLVSFGKRNAREKKTVLSAAEKLWAVRQVDWGG